MQFISMAVLIKRIKALKAFLFDKSVSKLKKVVVIFGIIYLFSPIDLIPAPILGFSVIDDLVLWGFILSWLGKELDQYWMESDSEASDAEIRKNLKGKKIFEASAKEADDVEGDSGVG